MINRKMKYIETGEVIKLPKKKIEDEEMKAAKLWDSPLPPASIRSEALQEWVSPDARLASMLDDLQVPDSFRGRSEHAQLQHRAELERDPEAASRNLLYNNWRRAYTMGIVRNINCGSLRHIGKTETLRRIITDFHNRLPVRRTILIVPNMNYRQRYEDLYSEGILNLIISNQNQLRGQVNAFVFADEVPEIEQLSPNANIEFIAGFYSR